MDAGQTISIKDVAFFQRTVKQKYDNLLRNEFVLPSFGSSIIRNEYLDKVILNSGLTPHFLGPDRRILCSCDCQKAGNAFEQSGCLQELRDSPAKVHAQRNAGDWSGGGRNKSGDGLGSHAGPSVDVDCSGHAEAWSQYLSKVLPALIGEQEDAQRHSHFQRG